MSEEERKKFKAEIIEEVKDFINRWYSPIFFGVIIGHILGEIIFR